MKKVEQATLQEVLESMNVGQRVEVVDLDSINPSILGGTALDIFSVVGPELLSKQVYSITYKKGYALIKLGQA